MQSSTDRVVTPLYIPTPEQIARDYVPKYHVFYDPTWGAPRAENLPTGVIEDKGESSGDDDD